MVMTPNVLAEPHRFGSSLREAVTPPRRAFSSSYLPREDAPRLTSLCSSTFCWAPPREGIHFLALLGEATLS